MKIGLLWVLIEKFGASFLSVAVFFVYAKLLSTEEMGIAIVILSVTQFLALLLNTFFEDALVQKKNLTEIDISTTFWVTVSLSLVLMLLTCGGFALWGKSVPQHSILAMTSFASLEILFTNLTTTYVARLRREGRFKLLALRVILGRIGGAAVGLVCIMSNLGAWSIISQSVMGVAFQLFTLLYTTRKIPPFNIQLSLLKDNARYGTMMALRRLSWDALVRMTPIAANIAVSPSMAGIVGFAWRIVELPRGSISSGLSGYLLPVLSRDRHDKEKMAKDFLHITGMTAFFSAPFFLGLYLIAPYMINGIFDARWHDTAPLIQIFCIAALISTYRTPATVSMNAAGHPGKMLLADATGSLIAISIMLIFGYRGSWVIGLAHLVFNLIIQPKSFSIISKIMGLSAFSQLSPLLEYTLPANIMFIALYGAQYGLTTLHFSPLVNMIVLIAMGGIIFLITSWFTNKGDIKNMIKNVKRTKEKEPS